MAYFELNSVDENARTLYYREIPQRYTFTAKGKWKERGNKTAATGRLYYVGANEGERFFLRELLTHRKGAKSFEDLRRVDGTIFATFQEACVALGLLESDILWIKTMEDAVKSSMPVQLRQTFVLIVVYNQIANPLGLFRQFQTHLGEDFLHRYNQQPWIRVNEVNPDVVEMQLLKALQTLFDVHNKSLKDYGLPSIPDEPPVAGWPKEAQRQTQFDRHILRAKCARAAQTITDDQKIIFDAIVETLEQRGEASTDVGKCFYIDGVAGGGKTWLLRYLADYIRKDKKIVLITAATGIAALLHDMATTAHKRFKVPLDLDDNTLCDIRHGDGTAQLIMAAKVIIIDEANMLHRRVFQAIDKSLRDLTKSDEAFGGITVVVSGDFRQCLPVVRHGTATTTVNATLKMSPLWQHFRKYSLTKNVRLEIGSEAAEWADTLITIGEGRTGAFARLDERICLPLETSVLTLIAKVYGDLHSDAATKEPEYLGKRAIITPLNDWVDNINDVIVQKLPGHSRVYKSCDVLTGEPGPYAAPTELLNSLKPKGVPPHDLCLKPGTVVICTRNLDETGGLMNGTRILIHALRNNALEGQIITEGSFHLKRVVLPRIKFKIKDPKQYHFEFTRLQFPIKIAFAMTVHKSEGQTLQRVGLYLPDPVFSHGMLYTAMSRTTTREGITVLLGANQKPPQAEDGYYTSNVVYRNVLR